MKRDSGSPLRRARSACLGLFLLAAGLPLASCESEDRLGGRSRAGLDPRVEQLRHWTPFRTRSARDGGDGSLFFLSRFEFREADLVAVQPAVALTQREPDLPVASVSLHDAIEAARVFWGRIPLLEEWRGAVEGRAGFLFPWGDTVGDQLRANTARIGLWRRTRVGTFESGRNLGRNDSCYDLIGNVAEWTLTPSAIVRLESLARSSLEIDEVVDRADAAVLIERGEVHGLPFGWAPASPWVAEFETELVGNGFAPRLEYCTVGFSCGQQQPLRSGRRLWQDRLGLRNRGSRERRWDLGFRMATDPYCFLAGLERAMGEPSEDDAAELRAFLSREVEAFRRAAELRTRRLGSEADHDFLALKPIGPWARVAYAFLAVPLP